MGNSAFNNHISSLTIDTGSGNQGAIGIRYDAANCGAMEYVKIDGSQSGFAGISCSRLAGTELLKHIEVIGFDYGLAYTDANDWTNDMVYEFLTLRNQRVAAIYSYSKLLIMRNVFSYQENDIPVVQLDGDYASLIMIDSVLNTTGSSPTVPAFEFSTNSCVYLRNIQLDNYSTAITRSGVSDITNTTVIGEYSPDANGTYNVASNSIYTLNLPVKEVPMYHPSDLSLWVNGQDYGAIPNDGLDDGAAIELALNTCPEGAVIYFPYGEYNCTNDILVNNTGAAKLDFCGSILTSTREYNLRIGAVTNLETRIIVSNIDSDIGYVQESNSTLVVKNDFDTTIISSTAASTGDIICENIGSRAMLDIKSNPVWVHSINPETSKCYFDDSTVWLFGFNLEMHMATAGEDPHFYSMDKAQVKVTNGSKVEAYVIEDVPQEDFTWSDVLPMSEDYYLYDLTDSDFSVVGVGAHQYKNFAARVVVDGATNTVTQTNYTYAGKVLSDLQKGTTLQEFIHSAEHSDVISFPVQVGFKQALRHYTLYNTVANFEPVTNPSPAFFSQNFSVSTDAGVYIDATTPSVNQFTEIRGGETSIDAGRLKIVNEAGVPGAVKRWVDMEGTPAERMVLSFEMDLTIAGGYAANTRLITGSVGDTNGIFKAWGIDATGVENEWNVTGITAAFTGPQTLTVFLNDSDVEFDYTDPSASTQVLAAHTVDIWVGTTQVVDGIANVQPEYDLKTFQLALMSAPAATYCFDNFEVLELWAPLIYQDDFSGAVGLATTTVPEVSPSGFEQNASGIGLDGNGRLESTNPLAGTTYRVNLGRAPLTDDPAIAQIKYAAVLRAPTNDWVMIGFQETGIHSMLQPDGNSGPVVQFKSSTVRLIGGTWNGGDVSAWFSGFYSAGDVITAEMTYHVAAQTMDLAINGSPVTKGWVLNHGFPVGTPSDPVVYWLQAQLHKQPSATNGGAYIESLQVLAERAGVVKAEIASLFDAWANESNLPNDLKEWNDDPDGDGINNLLEYALGGNPTQDDAASVRPLFQPLENYFYHIHNERTDDSSLTYTVQLSTNLVSNIWKTNGVEFIGDAAFSNAWKTVTNQIPTLGKEHQFIRLEIEME